MAVASAAPPGFAIKGWGNHCRPTASSASLAQAAASTAYTKASLGTEQTNAENLLSVAAASAPATARLAATTPGNPLLRQPLPPLPLHRPLLDGLLRPDLLHHLLQLPKAKIGRSTPTMPRLDDIARPAEDFVVIHATPEMNAEATTLLSTAAYARFVREPERGAKALMKKAICNTFGALDKAVAITDHFPEPYLVRFIFPHHRAAAVARQDFSFEGHRIQIRPWRLEDNADHVDLRQHVRLCVENVPLYLWNDAVAVQQVIGRACSLDYVEDACKMKTYTKALCLWAWVEHPGLAPHVRWVTLPGPSNVVPEPGRRGQQWRCIVHLDILEDKTVEEAPMPGKFTWRWGVVDGERLMRDRSERLLEGNNGRGGGRRDEDDDDRLGRRGRDGSRGWRDTLRRSLSRGAGLRTRDGG